MLTYADGEAVTTHYLVTDSEDNSVLAWWPIKEGPDKARRLASETWMDFRTGYWNGQRFVPNSPPLPI